MTSAAVPAASYVEELRHTVQVAALNFDVWWAYKQRRDRARFVDVLNAYPLFFQTSGTFKPYNPNRVERYRPSEGVTVLYEGHTTKWECLPVGLSP